MGTPKRILCPVDYGDASKAALRAATELAATLCAELVLLHVVNPIRFVVACPEACGLGAMAAAPVLARAIESAKHMMRHVAYTMLPPDVVRRVRVVVGSPVQRILGIARAEASDLIVVGTRSRAWWRRALDPSLAEAVARSASCPVLVVPCPQARDDGHGRQWAEA